MEFSIIVPTYMEEGCIEKCLRSLGDQRYKRTEFEIIVSDARSTDHTADIARQYTESVLVEDRKGIAYGRNVGAKKARGDIFIFVDADATLDQDFLSYCHQEFSNPAIVGMTGIAKPSDGGILQRFVYRSTYGMVRLFDFFGLSLFPGICVAYRRAGFTEVGGFREDFGIVEDLDLSRRISQFGTCTVNKKARALVSTRRLKKNLLPTVLFHMYCDVRYLITGKAPARYPKVEEIHSWRELWRHVH
ncbi:MAG: glycosyltransferase [Bacteroidota bacterium]|jgi:glycosyltransferase involved in cell wall biosynthesis